MEIRKLRHAVALAHHLNFTRAAQALNLSQSALSRSIQALEEECQLRLFDRNRNAVAITAAGREFVRHAEALLRKESELRDMIDHTARGDSGNIAIGMAPLAARTFLAPLMTEMIDKRGFSADVTIGTSKRLFQMLADESINLCVSTSQDKPSYPSFVSVHLARFPILLLVRTGHPLTHMAQVTPPDLAAYPILRSRPFELEDNEANLLLGLPHHRPALTVEDYEVLMRITSASDAIWTTSSLAAREWIASGALASVPMTWLAEQPNAYMTAHYLKGRTMTPAAKNFMERMTKLSRSLPAVS